VFVILHLHLKHILLIVLWIDCLITHSEKSSPENGAFIES